MKYEDGMLILVQNDNSIVTMLLIFQYGFPTDNMDFLTAWFIVMWLNRIRC